MMGPVNAIASMCYATVATSLSSVGLGPSLWELWLGDKLQVHIVGAVFGGQRPQGDTIKLRGYPKAFGYRSRVVKTQCSTESNDLGYGNNPIGYPARVMGNPQPSPIDRCLSWGGTDAVHRLNGGGGVIARIKTAPRCGDGLLGSLHPSRDSPRACCDTVFQVGSSPELGPTDSFHQIAPP